MAGSTPVPPEYLCMGCMAKRETPSGPCPYCGFDEAASDRPPHQLTPRTILNGKYLVGRALGEGGFGITYCGWDLNLEMKLAIKEYFPAGCVSREASSSHTVYPFSGESQALFDKGRKRFMQEARLLARFDSLPGIVGVKDFFLENGTAYIAMEFVDGITLKSYLAQTGGRLAPETVLSLMAPLMDSLAEIHRCGLIHRDISPDNIMLTNNGSVKLLDFGAAREFIAGEEKSSTVNIKTGYAPEEQYRTHGQQGPWTDIYALCATMYKCMTGRTPEEALERMRQDTVAPPSALGIALPPAQEAALMKGMAIDQRDRFQTVEELRAALYTGSPPAPVKKAGFLKWLSLAAALVVVAGIALWIGWNREAPTNTAPISEPEPSLLSAAPSGSIPEASEPPKPSSLPESSTAESAQPHSNSGRTIHFQSSFFEDGKDQVYINWHEKIIRLPVGEKSDKKLYNLTDVQQFAVWDGTIYYTSFEDHRLYSLEDGAQSPKRLSEDNMSFAVGPYLYDGALYYLMPHGTDETATREIVRIELNTLQRQESSMGRRLMSLDFYGGWMYYAAYDFENKNSAIYRAKPDGTEETRLFGRDGAILNLQVLDGVVYYQIQSREGKSILGKCVGTGNSPVDLYTDSQVIAGFAISDDNQWLYLVHGDENFDTQNGLYRISTMDGMRQLVNEECGAEFASPEGTDFIYFVTGGDGTIVIRMDMDGSNAVIWRRTEEPVTQIASVGDYIYLMMDSNVRYINYNSDPNDAIPSAGSE